MDFSTSQLTWILIGACSIGGTGYMTMDTALQKLDVKMEVTSVTVQNTNDKVEELKKQLSRIEDKMDKRK
jgi:anti-sigma28 factor (negative regulator of flagellin synthesis)